MINIPRSTGVVVTSLAAVPNLDVSMTLNVTTQFGRNQINRIAHSTNHFYPGTAQSDSTIELEPAVLSTITGLPEATPHVVTLAKPSKALQIATLRPVKVVITVNNVQSTIPVTRLLILDAPVTKVEIFNLDTVNTTQVILTYIT